jgi:hypothetical protein
VHDGGGIEAAGTAKENSALEKSNIGFGVKTITAAGALGSDQAKRFPGAQGGGRDAQTLRDLGDAEQPTGGQAFRWHGHILSA